MTDTAALMIDDTTESAKMLRRLAVLHSPDPIAQATALLTAATAIIELEVGRNMAAGALLALIEPTLAHWQAPRTTDARH